MLLGECSMKMFTKLALVSSMAISANAMAMQSMDDAAMSAATGQDGISLGIALGTNSNLQTFLGSATPVKGILVDDLFIHDNDGLQTSTSIAGATGTAATTSSGAIHIKGLGIQSTANVTGTTDKFLTLDIDSDAGTGNTVGTGAGGTAFLNIAAKVAATKITIGEISVAESGTPDDYSAAVVDVRRGITTNENVILSGLTLSMGEIGANVQLGSTPQGAMIKVDSTIAGGIDITDLGINDAANGGEIFLDGIHVRGISGAAIDVDLDINVKSTGLEIKNNSSAGNDLYIRGVHLGSATAASIGDVEVQGLHMGTSTITIAGH